MDGVTPRAKSDAGQAAIGPFDLNGLKTYELKSRPSRVFVDALGQPSEGDVCMSAWLASLPRFGTGDRLSKISSRICGAGRDGKRVVAALGGRAIENGCGPYVADWVQKGTVHAVALTGAAAIHDFELAVCGKTSEDVADEVACGRYGMVRETADAFAVAAHAGAEHETGLGAALGRHMEELCCPYSNSSVILAAFRAGVPCMIHVALGADTVHMHPHVCGTALGAATMVDFRRLCAVTVTLAQGIWLNVGSAAVIPETFLKALTVVRNFGHTLEGLLAVNIDNHGCDPTFQRALERSSYEFVELIGHPELLLPLMHAAVACQMETSVAVRQAQAA